MRIKLTLEYDGTPFCGWQTQPNGNSVQQEVTSAIKKVTGEDVNLVGSGRTDAGVHALAQVAHFDTDSTIPPERFAPVLNAILPDEIKVLKSELVSDDFNARYSAKRKTYEYRMYCSKTSHPLKSRYSVQIGYPLNVEQMRVAASFFVGEHDFKCFLASNSSVKSTVRTVYAADVEICGDEIVFTTTGNGFLYNMVRIMVGTIVKVGEGKMSAEDVKRVVESGDRNAAGKTMPAKGLVLKSVEYD